VAALCLVGFLPVIYLFVDLLVWKGKVPSYEELTPSIAKAFDNKWDSEYSKNPDVITAVQEEESRAKGYSVNDLKWKYFVGNRLAQQVGTGASSQAVARVPMSRHGEVFASYVNSDCGILSPLSREQGRWT